MRRIIITNIFLLLSFCFLYDTGLFAKTSIQKDQTAELKQWVTKYPPSKGAIQLERIASYAKFSIENNANYLWDPRQLKCDVNGNIYVLDNKSSCIFKFDKNGLFIKKAGRKGQGPGEFNNPYCFYVNNKYVLVIDNSNYCIQFFDLDLNYRKMFKVFKSYLSVAANDKFIFAMPRRASRNTKLVDVLDESGKMLFSFGEEIFGKDVSWQFPNMGYIDINSNDELAIAFMNYPTIARYNIKGKFIDKIDYDNDDKYFRFIRKTNNKLFYETRDRTSISLTYSFHFSKNGFYILKDSPYVGIIEYDYNGKRISEYWFERSVDYIPNDFIVRDDKSILLLIKSPEAAIDLFRPK
jgi:hypothetical protein